jgi:hypothetical protein
MNSKVDLRQKSAGPALVTPNLSDGLIERVLDQQINHSAIRHLPVDFVGWLDETIKGGPVEEVILFGSRVRGDHRPDSDIDLLIVATRPRSGPEFRAFERKLWAAAVAFDEAHQPICIGMPMLAIHSSRVRQQLQEGVIELFEALSQGVQLYPYPGRPSLHKSELASFSYRSAAARWLAQAGEFMLDAAAGKERLPRSHPLAPLYAKVGSTVGFRANSAQLAIEAAIRSGLFSMGMRPDTHSMRFMATTLGWPVSNLSGDAGNAEPEQLIATARECIERASALLEGVKLPRLSYDDRSAARLLLCHRDT